MPSFSRMALGVSLLAAQVIASPAPHLIPAIRVDQSLARRAEFAGGWSLAASECPSGAPNRCGESYGTSVNIACCPSSTVCYGNMFEPYCCPDNEDCSSEVHNFARCAGDGEVMYRLSSSSFFCCKKGQIGTIPISGYTGICRDEDAPPPSSLLATVVSQYGASAVGPNPSDTKAPTATRTGSSGSTNTADAGSGSNTDAAPGATSTTIINNNDGSSSSSSSSSSSNTNIGSSSPSLSTGAIAGIAIGGAAIIGIILALGWFCRAGRSRAAAPPPDYGGQQAPKEGGYPSSSSAQGSGPFVGSNNQFGAGGQEWKSPASPYSEMGGPTMNNYNGSGIVSPMPGRNELSP